MFPETLIRRRRVGVRPFNPDDEETPELLRRAGVTAARPRRVIDTEANEDGVFVARPVAETEPVPELLTRPRTALAAPSVSGAELRELGPAPLMRNSRGETLTRPQMMETGDRLSDLHAYRSQLEDYRNPRDLEGRGMSAFKSAGLMALQGFLTGGLPGAIRGGAYGAIRGAVTPNFNERLVRDRELGRVNQAFGGELLTRKTALDMQEQAADTQLKRARTLAELRPKPEEVKTFQGADGLQYEYDRETKTARLIPGQSEKARTPKVLRTVERGGKVWYETEEGLKPALDPEGRQLEEPMVDVTYGGQTFRVTEREAARMAAEVEAANITAGNTFGNQAFSDTVEGQNRAYQRSLARWEDAERVRQSVVKAREEFDKAADDYDHAKPEDKAYFQSVLDSKRRALGAASGAFSSNYPDLFVNDETGWATGIRGRPAPQEMPKRPAPQRRQFNRSAGQGRSAGGVFTEAEVRARARSQGKDENAAVEAARSKGLIR